MSVPDASELNDYSLVTGNRDGSIPLGQDHDGRPIIQLLELFIMATGNFSRGWTR